MRVSEFARRRFPVAEHRVGIVGFAGDAEGDGGPQGRRAPARFVLALRAGRRPARALPTSVFAGTRRAHRGGATRRSADGDGVHQVRQDLPRRRRASPAHARVRRRLRLAARSHRQRQEEVQVAAVRQPQPQTTSARHEEEHPELAEPVVAGQHTQGEAATDRAPSPTK